MTGSVRCGSSILAEGRALVPHKLKLPAGPHLPTGRLKAVAKHVQTGARSLHSLRPPGKCLFKPSSHGEDLSCISFVARYPLSH